MTAHLRDCSGAAEQRDPIMETQRACCSGLASQFGDEMHALLTGKRDSAELFEKAAQVRIVMRPSTRADFRPQCAFFRGGYPRGGRGLFSGAEPVEGAVHDAAELDRPVASRA